jgi:hypothetical protein
MARIIKAGGTGKPSGEMLTGTRGGRYHISATGTKVYEELKGKVTEQHSVPKPRTAKASNPPPTKSAAPKPATGEEMNRSGKQVRIHADNPIHAAAIENAMQRVGLDKLLNKHDTLDVHVSRQPPWVVTGDALGHAPTNYVPETNSLSHRVWVSNSLEGTKSFAAYAHASPEASFTIPAIHGYTKGERHHDYDKPSRPEDHVASFLHHEMSHTVEAIYGDRHSLSALGEYFRAKKTSFVSQYAKTNRSEWFAETHAMYCLNPGWLKTRHPDDHAMIEKVRKDLGLPLYGDGT